MNTKQLKALIEEFKDKRLVDCIEFNGVWGMVFEGNRGFKYYPKSRYLEICSFKIVKEGKGDGH